MSELKRIPREKNFGELRHYVLDKNIPPILEVEPGERFICEVEDSWNGVLRDNPTKLCPRDTTPYSAKVPAWENPLCGPIYVKGVETGDVLVVSIEKIDKILNGAVTTEPGSHTFTGLRDWEECDDMYTGIIENTDGKAVWKYGKHTYTWELKPFLGTIATAPQFEVLSALATNFGSALASGGNLDCRDVRAGAKIYLQSFNKGGLLSFGDLHASQGDGEVCSVANEAAGEVTLSCEVIKNKTLNNVRLETPESLISVCCYRPIEEAIKQALKDLILWLEENYNVTKREAYLLSSICPGFRINIYQCCANLGRLMTTVGAEFPRGMLPSN
jgi:acetamidase/formamidase